MYVKRTNEAMYVKRTNETRSCKHCCSGNTIKIICSQCVSLALGIYYTKKKRRNTSVFLSVSCLVLQYYSTLSHKSHDFGTKIAIHKMCLEFLYKLYLKNFHVIRRMSEI